ncbi:MAG: GAF domain-containing protein [Synergistaceae bacterium]|jgi:GAF domain-containing protein|nr:GAF domain-containing protein [Synergistaceae bacterium]
MHIEVGKYENKRKMYGAMRSALILLLEESGGDLAAGLANASALVKLFLEEVNWAGFYLMKDGVLVLGPFQGKPAAVRICLGEGVCGTAAAERKTQRVDDVHTCANHIACDLASSSEIVVPMTKNGEVFGVLDIDSPALSRFDAEDEAGLESLVQLLMEHLPF